jgi:hypothetical protein
LHPPPHVACFLGYRFIASGSLTVQGQRRFQEEKQDQQWHRVERGHGTFRRSVTLPSRTEVRGTTSVALGPSTWNTDRSWRVEVSVFGLAGEGGMARCVTCGSELHPERAEKYDYCTKRECRERNARPLTIAAVAVNKAADQYLVLDEQAKEDLAAGKYADQRKSSSVTEGPPRRGRRTPSPGTRSARKAPAPQRQRPPWSRSQEDLALIYSERGMRPDEVAERLGLDRYTVTQMILAAKSRVKL